MLLTNWAREMGLPAQGGDAGSLDQILRFVFGEHYMIQMKDGRGYEDKNLEVMLTIMADEFRVHDTTIVLKGGNVNKDGLFPRVELLSAGTSLITDPLGKAGDLSLVVSVVKGWDNPMPAPSIEGIVEMVREKVTFYSLTGEWATYKKDNL